MNKLSVDGSYIYPIIQLSVSRGINEHIDIMGEGNSENMILHTHIILIT